MGASLSCPALVISDSNRGPLGVGCGQLVTGQRSLGIVITASFAVAPQGQEDRNPLGGFCFGRSLEDFGAQQEDGVCTRQVLVVSLALVQHDLTVAGVFEQQLPSFDEQQQVPAWRASDEQPQPSDETVVKPPGRQGVPSRTAT